MSYLVLARKSRPQTFAEVVGQKAVVRTLQNALAQQRVAQALIFSGVRGTGKTTLARIMAKALNCEQGPATEPCNLCRSCRDIADGASIDLQEVDGASNRGIQEIRELKEKIRFMPTSSRYKIIIIDEVHMLTTEAFNALLKTLEEPPDHVYFMFATTELHKVPVTILSRCQRYELKRLGHRELAAHFTRLAEQEGVRMEPAAVDMIVREAGGSVRDGLSLLDQIFSYCGQEVRAEEVVEVLGLVSHQLIADLGSALLNGDLGAVYVLLDQMYLHGTDIKRFSNDLLQWFRDLVVCKVSKHSGQFLEVTEDEQAALEQTAASYSLETISALFNLLLEGLEKVSVSQQPRLTLELTFIRAVQFRDVVPVAELISRFDRLLEGASPDLPAVSPTPLRQATAASPSPKPPPRSSSPPTAQAAVPARSTAASVSSSPQPPTGMTTREPLSPPEPDKTSPLPAAVATNPPPATPSDAANGQSSPSGATEPRTQVEEAQPPSPAPPKKKVRQHWEGFVQYVRERQRWIAAALQMAASVECNGKELIIHFDDSAECTMLKQRNNVKALTEFLLDFFQEELSVQFAVPGSNACAVDPANGLAPQHERRALANDPLVLTALDVFTGQVGDIRIGSGYRAHTTPTAPRTGEEAYPSVEE
ncbi:DNA polymerase III, subunits gamma and tau [Desulfobulbus propionicus DSM 2032]|uniref:DNA polymerase III subunit gamma/tau n=1 Tax=Desulfobulbus propionicus (strain ATCC 33891 / DSM 2032 / VKM B-1956 / 1pr3) TaxID=577650 RepID=A0A7U3YMF0_DESPD|nr:DNA polymerase III subunit gamma/tau [Desulfobulbus propionicus]ADW18064.1 DNA polymerase III, subunits gamma and tau [Desulfobulbus propionicus DSM 2032]